MQNIINYFKEYGTKFEPRGNTPIPLNEGNHIYLVTEGSIDIFSIESKNGLPVSARKYIMRLTPYRLFLDSNQKKYDSSEMLMAVGNPATVVYRLSKQAFSKILKMENCLENAFWLLEEWLKRLLYRVFMPLQAQDYIDFSITNELLIAEKKYIMSKSGVIWIKHIEGKSAVCGDENILIDNTSIFPVSENIYVQTLVNSKFEKFLSRDLFTQDNFWEMIDVCIALALKKTSLLRKQYIEEERKRVSKRSIVKQITLKKGIFKIANILLAKSQRGLEEHFDADVDDLLACCNLIGKKLNIKFCQPKYMPENLDKKEKLFEIVRASRIRIRKVSLGVNWGHSDNGVLLSFNNENNHPIALIPKSPKQYYYIDLLLKEKILLTNDVAKRLEDFAYFFYRPFPDKPLSWKDLLKFGIFRNFRDLIAVFFVGIAGALLGLLNPYLTGKLFGNIIPSASINELNQMVYILLSSVIAITVFDLTRSIAMLRFEGKMDRDLQAALWDRLLSLPVSFFRRFTAGDLANRSLGIAEIRQFISGIAIQSILTGVFSVFYLIQLFLYNVSLALIALALGGVILLIALVISYFFVSFQMPVNEIEGKINGMLLQFINGISKLRATGTEDFAFQSWANKFSEMKRTAFKAGIAQSLLRCVTSIFPIVASMFIFSYIVHNISNEVFSIGDFAAYNSAYGQFQNSLLQMASYLTSTLYIVPIYKRLKPIIVQIPEVDDTKVKPREINGNISINNIEFKYKADGPIVLRNVSLEIENGEFVALVGQSGCGKSTLIRLLLGFEAPTSGTILYDQQDISAVDIREIRKQIGVVLQNSQVMHGSILKNIIGSSNLTINEAWQAAEMAGIAEDIKEMPMGMHTVFTSGGTLSGGQRQRLLIARAVVKKPRLIIFDEATSALDNRTQKIVSKSLEKLNATRLVVAHRLSTVKNADKICFLHNGTIEEIGTFNELMEKNGLFANLARRQLI